MTLKKCSQFVLRTCLARLTQSFSVFPPRKLLIWAVNSSIAQSHYCTSNDVKAKLSRKFHGEVTLFASAFAKSFLFTFCNYVYFSKSYESRSISFN